MSGMTLAFMSRIAAAASGLIVNFVVARSLDFRTVSFIFLSYSAVQTALSIAQRTSEQTLLFHAVHPKEKPNEQALAASFKSGSTFTFFASFLFFGALAFFFLLQRFSPLSFRLVDFAIPLLWSLLAAGQMLSSDILRVYEKTKEATFFRGSYSSLLSAAILLAFFIYFPGLISSSAVFLIEAALCAPFIIFSFRILSRSQTRTLLPPRLLSIPGLKKEFFLRILSNTGVHAGIFVGFWMAPFWLASAEVARYGAVNRLAFWLIIIPWGARAIFLPALIRNFKTTPYAEALSRFRLFQKKTRFFGAAIVAAAMILAKPLIGLVFGPSYLQAESLFRVLCLAFLLENIFPLSTVVALSISSRQKSLKISLIPFGSAVLSAAFLIPVFGSAGAAFSVLVFQAVLIGFSEWTLRRTP